MDNILIIGGDKRQQIAADLLKNKGYRVFIFNDKDKIQSFCDYSVVILPIPSTKDGETVFTTQKDRLIPIKKIITTLNGQLLITGNYSPEYNNYIDICKRYDFSILNAVPTAEAAISIAVEEMQKTLWKSKILIIGNGKIGKLLVSRLKHFGADITVSARKNDDFSLLDAMNIKHLNTGKLKNFISDFDVIFNTVPFPVLNYDELKECKKSCVLIELSSAPFGIDGESAQYLGLKFIYAPALPGKKFPITAGEILGETLKNIFDENKIYPQTDMRSDG